MSDHIGAAATFLSDWNDANASMKQRVQGRSKSMRDQAMESFAEAMRDCDRAIENIVDKHQENVARSAERLREYHKQLSREEARRRSAEEQRLFYEEALISALNARSLRQEDVLREIERREDFDRVG